MVRLLNKDNVKYVGNLLGAIMKVQELLTYVANVNHPDVSPCVYAMWHEDQFCVHGIPNRKKLNVLISNSMDGQIVARACEMMGYGLCRGSSNRKGAVSGTLKMISKLKEGENIAIMVDGPTGPLHKVKAGAIKLAREANVPIVPVHWYSTNWTFFTLPSWDKMTTPFGPCWLTNVYGEPIYTDGKTDEEVAEELKQALFELNRITPDKYKEARKQFLWLKRR